MNGSTRHLSNWRSQETKREKQGKKTHKRYTNKMGENVINRRKKIPRIQQEITKAKVNERTSNIISN